MVSRLELKIAGELQTGLINLTDRVGPDRHPPVSSRFWVLKIFCELRESPGNFSFPCYPKRTHVSNYLGAKELLD